MGNVVKEAGSEIALQVMGRLKATWTFTFSSSLALQMQKCEIGEAEVLRGKGA